MRARLRCEQVDPTLVWAGVKAAVSRLLPLRAWLVVSIVWAGAMAYLCTASWPHVPLDISAADPATAVALRAAILSHVGLYGLLAIGPPLLVLLAARALRGGR